MGASADQLAKFLGELATDPIALSAFRSNPEGAMTVAGLSDDDKAAVRSQQRSSVLASFAQAQAPQAAPKAPGDNIVVIVVVA